MNQGLFAAGIADWFFKTFLWVGLAFGSLSAVSAPTTDRRH
jgi:hypothetical protein